MELFEFFFSLLTVEGKKEGFKLWEGKIGSYIKKGGSGRKGKTISFFKKEKIIY